MSLKNLKKTASKLLIIDDDEATLELITEILSDTGISILKSEYGRESIKLLVDHLNDIFLILLDIRLPDCNGFELLKKIKTISFNIPIISMTAMSNYSISILSKESGFDAHIIKPFDLDEMKQIIMSYT